MPAVEVTALVGAVIGLLQAATLYVLSLIHHQTKRAPRRRTDPPAVDMTPRRENGGPSHG